MNKKYDHLVLLSELDADQFRLYNICATNNMYFATMIYNAICSTSAINTKVFKREWFIEWLNLDVEDDNVTKLESQVIKWIHDYPEFFDFYKGDWSVDSIINSVIQSWKNKPKTLRVNRLTALYTGYLKFLETKNGQNFLYGTTAYSMLDNMESDPYVPYYDQLEYKLEQLNKCRKEVIGEIAKSGTEIVESLALWDAIFKCEGKFTIAKAIEIAKHDPRMQILTDMQIRRHLNVLFVKLLKSLLKGDRIERYFDSTYTINIEGSYHNIRSALEYYLLTTQEDLTISAPKKAVKSAKIINNKVNAHAYTKDELKIVIDNWCKANGIPYSFSTGYYKSIAKLKADVELKKHKQYKLWIYEGGGYRDFYSNQTGYITNLIPKEYFEGI
jgi:hypothetical protein